MSDKSAMRFKTTSWTLIGDARDNRSDLEQLLAQYWSPVYAFLRRRGERPADAEDLTQAFLAKIVLDRKLISQADPARGRFRTYLISALKNFVIDEYRHVRGRDGTRAPTFIPDDPRAFEAAEPSEADDPANAFDRQWATAVLNEALRRVEDACRNDGMERQWTAFDARVLRPARHDCEPTAIEELLVRLGISEAQEIYSMIQTVKRKLDRELRAVVAETVVDTEGIGQELRDLRKFLAFTG
ncbi:MAG: sigma-70 family RNA polymerase sigma factor [Planctomycetes bacterium]|nr:sigma-70 family RNA polymerase sigma factor [Planctomycetota bacterium]